MSENKAILYLHGMGGGGDSRIPRLLREYFEGEPVTVVCRTYSFDPEVAVPEVAALFTELRPNLVIGESLGSIHALRLTGVPHLFVSPALGSPENLVRMAPLMHFRAGRAWASRKWQVKPGDRQEIIWESGILRKYREHGRAAFEAASSSGDYYYAFFGRRDHYRRSGVVSIRKWRRLFGAESFAVYDGTHFMEEEYVRALLVPKIREVIGLQSPQ